METRQGPRWWTHELATESCPISLEPLRALRCPPFELLADPTLRHRTGSDFFDGKMLSAYFVSSGQFCHPVSRREISRLECVALDEHCAVHKLCTEGQVAHAYDNRDAYTSPPGSANHLARLRVEADEVINAIFAEPLRVSEHRRQRSRAAVPIASEGNLTVVDDDARRAYGTDEQETPAASESFPALPIPTAPPPCRDVVPQPAEATKKPAEATKIISTTNDTHMASEHERRRMVADAFGRSTSGSSSFAAGSATRFSAAALSLACTKPELICSVEAAFDRLLQVQRGNHPSTDARF